MMNKRKKYSPEEKANIVLETLREENTLAEIANKYDVSQQLISRWRSIIPLQKSLHRGIAIARDSVLLRSTKQEAHYERVLLLSDTFSYHNHSVAANLPTAPLVLTENDAVG